MDGFRHVFLIPSDGSFSSIQGQQMMPWKGGFAADGRNTLTSIVSRKSGDGGNDQRLVLGGVAATLEHVGEAALGGHAGDKSNPVEGPRGRRLPDVEQLFLPNPSVVQQPKELLLEQLLHAAEQGLVQPGAREPDGQQYVDILTKSGSAHSGGRRARDGTPSPIKHSGRERRGEKGVSSRSSNAILDSHLALQTALVTMLHLQAQGGLQRKPVFPKRNLLCLSFLRLGICPNRESCNYAHNMTELQKKLELRKTSLCKYWLKGKCENEDCNFAHGEHELQSTVGVFKTTICKYWRQGCCYSGELCRHAHGDADLRPENLPPHLERKKRQQQQSRLSGRGSGHRRERMPAACGAEAVEENHDKLKDKGEVTFDCLRQVINGGMLPDSGANASASSLDTLLAKVNSLKRWDTQGSSSSDRSTDALLSPASESPRCLPSRSCTSISSASMWSLSPEHSFTSSTATGLGNGCALPRQAAPLLTRCSDIGFDGSTLVGAQTALLAVHGSRRSTEPAFGTNPLMDAQEVFGAYGKSYSSPIQLHSSTAPPPGLTGLHSLRGAEEMHCRLPRRRCDLDKVVRESSPYREKDASRTAFAENGAEGGNSITWSAAW